jgi:HAD superfamily hydrolase (TIGR01490 family)
MIIMNSSPSIAFFDLDKTIIRSNSAKGWVRREFRDGHIRLRDMIKASGWLFLYGIGKSDMEESIRSGAELLAGSTEASIQLRCVKYWEEEIRFEIREKARIAISKHRNQGDILVLLTSSSNYLADLVAKELQIEHVLCNTFQSEDGVLTGTANEPLCFGRGKVVHAQKLAKNLGASLDRCYFYTDSFSDVHVLRTVGYPVVISPDVRLRREAISRGWPLEQWD